MPEIITASRVKSTEVTIMETRKKATRIVAVRYLGSGKFLVVAADKESVGEREFGL